jgi:hypothetical protein
MNQGHGRHETRELYAFEVTPEQAHFPHASMAAVRVSTTHYLKSLQVTQDVEILVTSRDSEKMTPAEFLQARRNHWGIETQVNYVRDTTFGEDKSTNRTDHGPQNMATLRNLVIGMCAIDAAKHGKKTSWLPKFRREAKNNQDKAVDLVAKPLLNNT